MEGRRSLPSRAARPSVGSLGPGSPKPSIRQAAPSSASKKQAAPASATKQKPANAKPADAEVPAYYAAPKYESPRAGLLASRDAAAVTQFFVGMSGYLRIKPFSIREFEDALLNPTGAAAADQAQSSGVAAVSSSGAGATSSAAASSSSSPSSLHPLLDICLSRLLIRDKQLRNKLNPDEGMGGDWVNRQLRDTIHTWYNRRHTLKQLMDVTIERSRAQLKVGMPRELCMEDSSKAVEEVLHLLEGDRSSAAAASSGKGGKQQLAGSKRKAGRSAADGNNEDADDDAIINGGGVLPRTGSLPQVPSDSAHSKFADTDGYDADDWEDNEELEARLSRGEAYDAERHRAHRRARLAAAAAAQAAPLKSLDGGGVSESKGGDEDADAGDGSPSKRLRVADGAQAGGAPNSAEKAAMDYRSSIGDQQQETVIGTPGASLFVGPIHPGTVTAKVAELMRLQTVNAQGEEIDEAEAAARAWRMLNGLPVDAAKGDDEDENGDGDGSEDGENGDGSTGLPRIRKVKKSVSLADRFKEQLKAMEKLTDEDIADALCVHAKDHDEADEDDVAEAYEMDGLLEPLDEYTAAASKSGAAGTGGDGSNAAAAGSAETPADAPHLNASTRSRAVADPLSHTRWADAPLSLRLKILQALIDSRVCTYEDDIHLELNSDKYADNDSYASRLRMECLGSDKSGNSYLVFPQQLQHTASSSGSSRQEEPMIRVYKDGTAKYKSGRVVRSWTPIATDLQSLEALLAALGAPPPPRWSPTDTESLHAVPKMVRTAAMEEGTNSSGADPQLIIALFGMLEQARMKIDRETLKKAVEIRKAKAQAAYDAIPRRKSGRLHAEPEGELLPGIGYTNSGNPAGGGDGGGSGASIMSSAASATGEDGTSRAQATSPVMDTMEDGLDGINADNGNQQQQQQHDNAADGGGGSASAGNDDVAMDGGNGAGVAPSPSAAGEQQQLQQLATFTSTPAPNAMAATASPATSTDRPKRAALLVAEQKLASAAPIQRPKSDRAQLISSLEKMRHKDKVATIAILIADLPWWERFIGLHWNALPHAERYHTDVTKARLEEKKAWLVNEERERLRRIDKERQRREREAEQRLEQLEQVEAEAMKKEESNKELAGEREIRKQRREQGIAADWDPRIWGWPGASGLRLRIRLAGTHTEDVMAWFHESDNVVATIPADGSAEDAVPVPAAGVGAGSASSSAVPAGAQPPAAASKLLVIIDEFARYVRQLRSDGYAKADVKTGKDAARFAALGVTEPPAKQPKPAPKPRQSIGGAAAVALAGSAGAAASAGHAGAATPSASAASTEFTGTKSRPSRSSMETAEFAEPQDPWIWSAEPADGDATDRSMSNAAAGIPAAHIIRDGEYQDPETGKSTTVASNIKIRISREERRIVEEREAAAAAAAAARAARIAAEAAAAREAARISAGGEPFPSSSGASAGGGMMMGQSPSRRSPAHAHQAMPGVRSPQSNAAYLAMHSHAAAAQQYQYQHQHQQQVPYQQQQVFKQRSPARAPSGPFVAAAGSSMSAGGVPMEQPWRYAAPAQQHQQQAYHSQQHQQQQYEYNQHQQQYWQQGADAYGTAPFLNQGQQQQQQYRSAFDGIAAAAATSDPQVQHLQQRHYADAARADELMDDDETAGQGYDNEHDDQRVDGGGAGYGYEQQQQAQQQQQQQQYYAGYGGGAAQGAPAARASPPQQQQQQQFQSHGAPSAGGPTGGSWGFSGSGVPTIAPANGAGSAAGPRPGISYPDSLLSEWDNLLKALRPNLENLPSGRANAERNGAWRSLCARHGIDPMPGHSTYGTGSGSDGGGAAGYNGGAAGGGAVAYAGGGGGNRPSPTHMSVPGRTMSVMISSPRMPSAQTAANAMLSIAPQGMVMGDINNHGQQQY